MSYRQRCGVAAASVLPTLLALLVGGVASSAAGVLPWAIVPTFALVLVVQPVIVFIRFDLLAKG